MTQLTVKENQATGALKQQVNYGYDGYGNMTTVTVKDTEKDSVITQEFGSQYNGAYVTKQSVNVTNADGEVSTMVQQMEYDKSTGALTKFTDPKGYSTTYQYDKLGRITRETGVDSSEASVAYDNANNKITLTDVNGEQSIQEFNPLGLKTRETLGRGFATYGYDLFGRTIWSKDAKENQTSYTYDAWGRNIKTSFPDGSSSVTSYDDVGRTKTSTDEENNSIRETYDILGRVIKSEEVKSSGAVELGKVSYDFAGNPVSKTDGNGKQSTYKYDLLGRLVAVTDPDMNSTQYTYSLAGNLTELRYADGSVQRKKYDEIGRQIQKIQPQGQTETTYYDLNSNLIKKVDPKGIVREYEYNNRNWLIKDRTPEESISYTYDKAGKRKSLVDATGTTSYDYSPKGELVSIQYPDAYKIDYAYDIQGQRTDAVSDVGQTYTYNERNRIVGLQIKDKTSGSETIAGAVQYQYKKNGFLEQSNLSNGLQTVYTYDGFNMTGLQNQKQNATLGAYGYKYDTNRNITEKTELGTTSTFSYDALNRVKTSSQFNETYEYDNRGNRASLMTDRELSENGSTYTYDDRDRLKKVVTADGKEVSYRYNGDGLLYERTENGKTIRYYYDDSQHLIREAEVGTDGTITPVYQYIYSPAGSILARKPMTANTGLQYYTLNGHGDVVALRDSNGNVLNEYTYDIWGNPVTEKETVPNNFRYSGEYWDNTIKLQYLRARWYDPNLGRFINEDTYEGQLDNPLSLNLYTYVSNNPLTHKDPSGHAEMSTGGGNTMSQDDIASIEKYAQLWKYSNSINDRIGMQMAHDEANLIRLKYVTEVSRNNYIYGGSNQYTINMYNETFNGNVRPDAVSGFAIDTLITLPVGGWGGAFRSTGEKLTLKFSQKTASVSFSVAGSMAGKTIGQVAGALRAGKLSSNALPVSYVIRDGSALIVNTRSSLALTRAGISQSKWTLVNKTGNDFFENLITERLSKNGLGNAGIDVIRITGNGSKASNLQ